jgi:hypothetical protein
VIVVCCQVEFSATSRSLAQRSPTECGVSKKCDREASTMSRPWPTGGCCTTGKKTIFSVQYAPGSPTYFEILFELSTYVKEILNVIAVTGCSEKKTDVA